MKRIVLLALAASLAACQSQSDPDLDQTGERPDLPQQSDTLLPAMKIPTPKGWDGELPTVPEGFTVTAIAKDLKIPRQMLLLPNGDILVAEGSGGHAPAVRPKDVIAGMIKKRGKSSVEGGNRITLLRDRDGDGQTDLQTTFIDGLDAPYGLAFVDGKIYVANQGNLVSFDYTEGATRIDGPGTEVTKLPSVINHHWTKAMTASPDGSKLYVGIGSNSNVGERGMDVEEDRAVIWEIDRQTGANRIFASGIRNPTALSINPWTEQLWAVVNERDELGPQLLGLRQLLLGAHEIAMHSGNEGARLAVLKMAKRLHSDATQTIYDSIVDPETNLGVRRIEAFLCWHTPTIRQLFGKPATFGVLTP